MGAENKRFTVWGNRIKREGKLLNINFETKTDAKLCCKLCNQMDKEKQEFVDKVDEIHRWYKEYYGETILDTKMGWNEGSKISKLEKKNEQLKEVKKVLKKYLNYYTERALLLKQPYDDVTEAIHNIADELGVDL